MNGEESQPLIRDVESVQKKIDDLFDKDSNKKISDLFNNRDDLLTQLNVDLQTGLDPTNQEDMLKRSLNFVKHQKIEKKRKTFWSCFYDAFTDFLMQELFYGSLVGATLGILKDGIYFGWVDSGALLLAVIICCLFTAIFKYRKEKKLFKLNLKLSDKVVLVKRQGEITSVDQTELITGDLLQVKQGDFVEVPGVLVRGKVLGYNRYTHVTREIWDQALRFFITSFFKNIEIDISDNSLDGSINS